jgi:hypothetical protein
MAKTLKMTKMASREDPHPTVCGSEGWTHINLHKEVLSGFEKGMKGFKGTYYRQVKLVQVTELDMAVALKALETKIEYLIWNFKLLLLIVQLTLEA